MDELLALHAFTVEVGASLSVTKVVEKAVAQTAAILDPDAVFLYLREDDALHLRGHRERPGMDPSIVPLMADVVVRLCSAAMREGRPFYSRDMHADALRTCEGSKEAGIRSIAVLPLGYHDGALGVLSLASLTERDFAAHRPLLEILASQVSIALQNARINAQMQQHAETIRRELDAREKLEIQLRQSEERYRALVEDMPAMICRFLPDGTLTFVNAMYCSYFGATREELAGQNFFQFIPEQDRESVRRHYLSLTMDNPMVTYQHQVVTPDGQIAWQEWTDRAIFDSGDIVVEYQSIGRDVTKRIRMELALRQSEEMFRSVVQNSEAVIFVLDRDGIFRLSEGRALSKLGFKPGEVVGTSASDMYRDYPIVVESIGEALAGRLTRALVGRLRGSSSMSPIRHTVSRRGVSKVSSGWPSMSAKRQRQRTHCGNPNGDSARSSNTSLSFP